LISPEPDRQRIPFEQGKGTPDQYPTPAELNPTKQSIPKNLKPTPVDPPPALVPKPNPPKTNSVPTVEPNMPNMPDVLVDPFKDDASFRGTRQKMEGILLTGGRRVSNDSPKNKSLDLKPSQRQSPLPAAASNLQFEASGASSESHSQVVSSSYLEVLPVKVVRREFTIEEPSNMPQVPKIRVPQRR